MDKKINFAISSLSLKKNEPNTILDNYIKINNPQYITKKNKLFRNNKEDYLKDAKYVDGKYEKYLSILSNRLNVIHNSSFDEIFWRQYFYLGLQRYVTLVYEFFKQIETRFNHNNYDFRLVEKKNFYTPFDLEDLRDYLSNSEYAQEQLFTIYYQLFHKNSINNYLILENEFKISKQNNLSKVIDDNHQFIDTEVILFGVACDQHELKKVMNISNKKILFIEFKPFQNNDYSINHIHRDYLSKVENNFDRFDNFFFATLKTLCPTMLIENFDKSLDFYKNLSSYFPNLKYCVSEHWISDHQMSTFIAILRTKKIKFIYNEHRGIQHPFINNFTTALIKIADIYLTQGWYNSDFGIGKLVQSGILMNDLDRLKIINQTYSKKDKILFMTAPAYVKRTNYNSQDFFMGEDSEYYFNFQYDFFSNLNKSILNNIIFRDAPIMNIRKWLIYNVQNILGTFINSMQKDTRNCSGLTAMLEVKLVIIDYLGSGYMQALAHNIPVILFLNKNSYLNDSYKDLFDEIIEVGILHTDAKCAADFITKIENNPLDWWLTPKVQEAKNNLLDKILKGGDVFKENLFSLINKKEDNISMTKINLDFYKGLDHYSDGNIEDGILEIVKYTNDFTDILNSTDSWPIFYHLSPIRRNLLSWYNFDKNESLLEIGGGCGAFSGMFAEKLKDVKVVELSKRRSEIIYNRHKNYNNLEIIVGNLNDIIFKEKFNYVTLIGVLEYAGKFTDGNTPFKTFLENIKSYLKPEGKLILAIENKFGIKYWAGAKEDHTGRFFDSIENYQNDKSIQTFGKFELDSLLKEVGFNKINFYYPTPDYKLPKCIYSDDYLPKVNDLFDVFSQNFDQNRYVLFNEREALKNIINNNQFPFFANSFLIEASI